MNEHLTHFAIKEKCKMNINALYNYMIVFVGQCF